ncbi:hypothetical protein ABID52_003893 [Fictibacillus halophilus]|uniref:Flp pilus-assembly TadG-like N-terminal domain-containing protein n=1 Tax=Fictibacillus halophilus TaxID=1610490 RepID=A0ABV2LRP9_9BACL|nr:pilus assembly protein TadG-related protein [Fictibacillus halophilus]
MSKQFSNEKGNIALLTLGLMSVMIIMFLFLTNFVKVFSIKEQASTNAQQASLAATSIVYEEVDEAIDEYEMTLIANGKEILEGESLSERINKRQEQYSDLNQNEAHIKAVDEVLSEELSGNGIDTKILNDILIENLTNSQTIESLKYEVSEVISSNKGTVANSEIVFMDDSQITVKTSSKYKALKFDSFIPDDQRDINQTGTGPEISFIEYLDGWSDITIELN